MTASNTISAAPTKRFFVEMLVRDIALEDAILDLLDNCIDGVVRTTGGAGEEPYKNFEARITMNPGLFEIKDNCGGIPKNALERAFRMGRPDGGDKGGAATVGMYGIGMKRAIFKLGTEAKVASRSPDVNFEVGISQEWLKSEDDWQLPISYLEDVKGDFGTTISVPTLTSDVSARFDESNDNFISYFKNSLSSNYTFIILKGFKVFVNGEQIKPQPFNLLVSSEEDVEGDRVTKGSLKPYVFRGDVDGVSVQIFAGLSRPLPTDEEIEKEEEVRQSRDDAGWTIICNDRIVVYRDKTRLTGWGEASVPSFHGQFISFSGLVILKSDDPWKLPLTTTKRGIDASSELYLSIKDFMREATKTFTSFTNKWKRNPEERSALYKAASPMSVSQLQATTASYDMTKSKKLEGTERFMPLLPVPKTDNGTVRISYARPRAHFVKLAEKLFETSEVTPRDLGETTFELVYEQLVRASK
ncbi:ATP-binding protein [Rhizobium pusense]|uniref:ATP-binding protein n=1 Tax=Agrobacterium pusense TaxID=648995 RepID=UPI001C6F2B23|nr:ATP-binding protein [Agrobacterium pusense]